MRRGSGEVTEFARVRGGHHNALHADAGAFGEGRLFIRHQRSQTAKPVMESSQPAIWSHCRVNLICTTLSPAAIGTTTCQFGPVVSYSTRRPFTLKRYDGKLKSFSSRFPGAPDDTLMLFDSACQF